MATIIRNNNLDNNSKLKLFLIMNKSAVNLRIRVVNDYWILMLSVYKVDL